MDSFLSAFGDTRRPVVFDPFLLPFLLPICIGLEGPLVESGAPFLLAKVGTGGIHWLFGKFLSWHAQHSDESLLFD